MSVCVSSIECLVCRALRRGVICAWCRFVSVCFSFCVCLFSYVYQQFNVYVCVCHWLCVRSLLEGRLAFFRTQVWLCVCLHVMVSRSCRQTIGSARHGLHISFSFFLEMLYLPSWLPRGPAQCVLSLVLSLWKWSVDTRNIAHPLRSFSTFVWCRFLWIFRAPVTLFELARDYTYLSIGLHSKPEDAVLLRRQIQIFNFNIKLNLP